MIMKCYCLVQGVTNEKKYMYLIKNQSEILYKMQQTKLNWLLSYKNGNKKKKTKFEINLNCQDWQYSNSFEIELEQNIIYCFFVNKLETKEIMQCFNRLSWQKCHYNMVWQVNYTESTEGKKILTLWLA